MTKSDPKAVLWPNICALMGGSPSIDAVREKTKLSRGTVQRIRQGETSVSADVITAIATAFRLQPWQLLVPGINPSALPRLSGQPGPPLEDSDPVERATAVLAEAISGVDPKDREALASTMAGWAREGTETWRTLVLTVLGKSAKG